jgi:hypothetical protein
MCLNKVYDKKLRELKILFEDLNITQEKQRLLRTYINSIFNEVKEISMSKTRYNITLRTNNKLREELKQLRCEHSLRKQQVKILNRHINIF